MSNQTFINQAFYALCEYKGFKGDTARFVSNHLNVDDTGIAGQYVEGFLSAVESEDAVVHRLSVLGSLQDLMNKVSWNARKLFKANIANSDMDNNGAPWGLEASERVRQLVDVDADNEELIKILESDFEQLQLVHTILSQQTGIDTPLYYFVETERQPNGDWVDVTNATTFDDAMTAMDNIVDKLNEQSKEDVRQSVRDALGSLKKAA
jgi:hypothetical protein